MKKTTFLILLIAGSLVWAATVTNVELSFNMGAPLYQTPICKMVEFDNDVNNVTVALDTVHGWIDEIVIDSTGTDTSFKVYIKDENSIAVFSKTDCSSASEPYRLPVQITDGTRYYYGARVNGAVSVQIADANNATLTDLTIYVYLRDYRK